MGVPRLLSVVISVPLPVVSRTGKMLVHFFSDIGIVGRGFEAVYTIELCPNDCYSGRGWGTCDPGGTGCNCTAGHGGADCGSPICPGNCYAAAGQGSCG